MRLITLFLIIGISIGYAGNSYSQATTLSLELKNKTVREVFREIEQHSEYIFLYNRETLDSERIVSISADGESINNILDKLFKGTDNTYKVSDRQVYISRTEKLKQAEITEPKQSRKKIIQGIVLDQEGESIIGANVIEVGTTNGTVTDIDGNFTLTVENNARVRISYIGYIEQTIDVSNLTTLNIILQEDAQTLDELVVVGYGVQNKNTVVGAVAVANEEDLQRIGTVTDITQAISGQIPGIVSLTSTGEPGGILTGESATNIFIRGQNTWNGGQPLILVDGAERDMNNIDVNEISSISVLKDASATAVYGVKGANGVILITTKRGHAGKTVLNFNYTTMGQMVSKLPEKLDSYETLMLKNEMIEREVSINAPSWIDYTPYEIVQRYRKPQSAEYARIYPNVDWADEMFKDLGFSHRATLSARGGSKRIQFFGLLAFLHEGDMFEHYDNNKGYSPNYNFDRFNFRSNIDAELTKTTKLRLDISGYYSQKNTNYNNEGVATGRADHWMWAAAYRTAPNLFIPRHEDGRWGATILGDNNTLNPLAVLYNSGIRQTRTTQLNFDLSLEQDLNFITKGLSTKASLFYDNSIRSEGGIIESARGVRPNDQGTNIPYVYINSNLYEGPDQDPSEYTTYLPYSIDEYDWYLRPWVIRNEYVQEANWSNYIPVFRRLIYQAQLNYSRRFGQHNTSALAVFKRDEYAQGSMFKNYREDWVFRVTYDYDYKYLLEVNGAYNGSEQFGPGYRFDFFPSLAVGWVISNEKFFDKLDWVDNLKLRYSIGKVGDDKVGGGRWLYSSQYARGGTVRLNNETDGESPYTFYRETVLGNPDIQWETAVKNNLGVEFSMLKNLFSLNFDYFTEDRTNILMTGTSRSIPPFFGTNPPSANLGHVKSKGYELELEFNKTINKNASFWTKLALAHNENSVIFRDDPPLQYSYLKNEGYSIGQNRSKIRAGFYNNWDDVYASVPLESNDLNKLPGYYNILDFNADGMIKDEDRAPIGYSTIPQNTVNLSIGGTYKRWSMHFQIYGMNNVTRFVEQLSFFQKTDILFAHASDYWSKDNQNATSFLPRWKTEADHIGDYYYHDASSIRLRTAEISYSLNGMKWIENSGISNLRIFINGNNLLSWSRLPDDRETSHSGGNASYGAYPMMRRINLGIDLSF